MNYRLWISVGVILIIIGLILSIIAVVWHSNSASSPKWTSGMKSLFGFGIFFMVVGFLLLGVLALYWGVAEPLAELEAEYEYEYPTEPVALIPEIEYPEEPEVKLVPRGARKLIPGTIYPEAVEPEVPLVRKTKIPVVVPVAPVIQPTKTQYVSARVIEPEAIPVSPVVPPRRLVPKTVKPQATITPERLLQPYKEKGLVFDPYKTKTLVPAANLRRICETLPYNDLLEAMQYPEYQNNCYDILKRRNLAEAEI